MPLRRASAAGSPPAPADETGSRSNLLLLVQLRWLAVAGQIATVLTVRFGFGIDLPLVPMGAVLAGLILLNLASLAWLRIRPGSLGTAGLLLQLLLDVAALTLQLGLSGGAANPFTCIYLLQVVLAAVLLEAWAIWIVVVGTCLCVVALALLGRPLALPGEPRLLHALGTVVGLAVDAALLGVFVGRITRNLRRRDAHLADLRQQAAEEEHILRMGLLASGAAHELGTPLASLAVILGDWGRMPRLADDPDLRSEIEDMQAAVGRCKSIVTGILLSAGEARVEAPELTSVSRFFKALIADWRVLHPGAPLAWEDRFGEDLPIVADAALKQAVFNLMDNALEASPGWVELTLLREDDMLVLRIQDRGPGFAPEMLAGFGKPYSSSKRRPGGGIGLFLSVNVARTLGGSLRAENRPQGGATVTLRLPLATLEAP